MLKSFIHEEKLNFDTELDWAELLKLCSIHSLTGILGYMSMQNPGAEMEQMAGMLKKQCFANIAIFTRKTENAKRLIDKLNDSGIDHVLSKGYILREYYPVPELRSFGDVDILIKPEDRKKCHELMLEMGFSVKDDWEPVFSYYKEIELYEFHTNLAEMYVSEKVDYTSYFGKAWEHVKNIEACSYELSPEFHFLYLITHVTKHISESGAGIRMYMDLSAFIKHFGDSIDWAYIESELEKLKLRDFTNIALTAVEKYFGVTSPIKLKEVPEDILERFMDFTFDGGVFGHVGRDSGLITLKDSEAESRVSTVLHRLFPPAESIEPRYTYLQGRHWLLPVAWLHRFIKTLDGWERHTAEVKSIMNTDEKEVEKLRSIYRDIGL